MAIQHTRTSYRWPSVRSSRISHVSVPFGLYSVGNIASKCVLIEKLSGVSVSILSAASELLCAGMLTVSGPRKMVFSVLADTRWTRPRRRLMRLRINMAGLVKYESEMQRSEVVAVRELMVKGVDMWLESNECTATFVQGRPLHLSHAKLAGIFPRFTAAHSGVARTLCSDPPTRNDRGERLEALGRLFPPPIGASWSRT